MHPPWPGPLTEAGGMIRTVLTAVSDRFVFGSTLPARRACYSPDQGRSAPQLASSRHRWSCWQWRQPLRPPPGQSGRQEAAARLSKRAQANDSRLRSPFELLSHLLPRSRQRQLRTNGMCGSLNLEESSPLTVALIPLSFTPGGPAGNRDEFACEDGVMTQSEKNASCSGQTPAH
jgi:hypothetical protein